MKPNCEGCAAALPPDGEAYICSHGCTFCLTCYTNKQRICPHCGGELVRRPRAAIGHPFDQVRSIPNAPVSRPRGWMIWAISFGVWSFVALAGSVTFWQLYRTTDMPMSFRTTLGLELSQILTYVPLTPLVFWFAMRYPIRRENWRPRTFLYLTAGVLFCMTHVTLRGATHFALYNSKEHVWNSAIWDPKTHAFAIQWAGLRKLFLNNLVDDITGTFVPIVIIAHAIAYYRKYQERENRATQLEGQLAKAHLQALKSQLQPHFLFNTMHSVSALMLTNVEAADRMITRLADLLRMNLESAGTQISTLSREMEFVHCYLEIEKVRFEERLTLVFDIAPETLDAQVPLLLLQPLVDNAVKHGISHMPKGGEIHISSRIQNDELKLEVRDNGPGFARSKQEHGFGLGLRVTRERLQTLYGKHQGVEVACPPEGGVAVVVTIPFRVWTGSLEERFPHDAKTVTAELQESA